MNNEALIYKHNDLINSMYDLTELQMKLFLKLVSLIRKEDNEFKLYEISIKDFLNEIGSKTNAYKIFDKITTEMMKKIIYLPSENNNFYKVTLMTTAIYKHSEGRLFLKLHNELKPYLLNIQKHFTAYYLKYALKLNSFYSIRIYELLKQYEKIKYRKFEIQDLKKILGIENKYKLYHQFKQRIILKAQKDLKEFTDIYFEFEEIKTGRKITSIKFMIYSNVQSQTKSEILIETNQEIIFHEDLGKLLDILPQDLKTQNIKILLNNYLTAKDLLYCESNLKYCLNQRAKKEINNFSGYLKKALDENLGEELKLKVENDSLKQSFMEKIKNMSEEEKLNLKVEYFKNLPKDYQNYIIETVFKTDRQYKLMDLESAIRVYSEFHFNLSDILKSRGL